MKTIKFALIALHIFSILPAHASFSNSLIRLGYRSYLKTSGEAQLLGAATGSYKIWKKLQTPALKKSPLWMQRSLGGLGMLLAYHAYRQIPETRVYRSLQRSWHRASIQNKKELAEINSFFDKTAYPASWAARFAAAYFISTSFFGTPEQLISEKTASRAVAGILIAGAEGLFRLGLANYSILSSESLKPRYPATTFRSLAQSAIHPDIFDAANKIRRGITLNHILLYGEPGQGKTTLVEALAGETGVPLFIVQKSDITRDGNSNAEANLALVFLTAVSYAIKNPYGRAIIFIDELESIATNRRMRNDGTNASLTGYLNLLMGGCKDHVTVIACTNLPDVIDGATTRPGRLGKKLEIEAPTQEMRQEIFDVAMRDAHIKITDRGIPRGHRINFRSINVKQLADITHGQSTAFIVEAVHEAYRSAFTHGITHIDHAFIEEIVRKELAKEAHFKKRTAELSGQATLLQAEAKQRAAQEG